MLVFRNGGDHTMLFFGKPDTDKMRSKKDVKGLLKALAYKKDKHVRYAAATALGEISDPAAFQPLVKAFQVEKGFPQRGIIEALATYGKPAADVLMAALKDRDSAVDHGVIAQALARIKDDRAVGPLISALQSVHCSSTQVEMIEALATFGEAATGAIMGFLDNKDVYVSLAAERALKTIGSLAVPALVAALSQGDWLARFCIVKVLGEIGTPEVVNPLIAALDDKSMRSFVISRLKTESIARILPEEARRKLAQAEEEKVKAEEEKVKAEEEKIKETIKSFPESWQQDPEIRAYLLSIMTSPPNSHGLACPYYCAGVCRFRHISRHEASAGPEKCSLVTASYTSCFVWHMDPR
jgi:HEAT repeat protein